MKNSRTMRSCDLGLVALNREFLYFKVVICYSVPTRGHHFNGFAKLHPKNVGHFQSIDAHDPFKYLRVSQQPHMSCSMLT